MMARVFLLLLSKELLQSWAAPECQNDQTSHVQKHLQVSKFAALESEVSARACDLSDLDSGVCSPTECTECNPSGRQVIPSTLERFQSGSLSCGRSNSITFATTSCTFADQWPAIGNFFEFWSSKDHLNCQGTACSQFNVHNMGAACCDGPDACKRSNFQFNGENKCGFADVCCRGTRTCEDGIFTGVRSMACSGSHACFNATVRMTGDLFVVTNNAADRSDFTWTTGGSHCIRTYGPGASRLAHSTLTFEQSSNIQMDCTGGTFNTCRDNEVKVPPGSCLHVICSRPDSPTLIYCSFLKVKPLVDGDLDFECYCTGGDNCNWISSFTTPDGGTLCKRTTDANPNPCRPENGPDICPGNLPCCMKSEATFGAGGDWQDCSGCNCDIAADGTLIRDTGGSGTVVGDPHLRTLDGRHYTLMEQGNFLLWGFSGYEAEVLGRNQEKTLKKKAPVEFEIFTHYAGHASFTKGLLLVDKSKTPSQALEVTTKDCLWRHKNDSAWSPLTSPSNLTDSDGNHFGAFQLSKSRSGQNKLQLLINDGEAGEARTLAQLWVSCRTGHQLSAKIKMPQQKDLRFVRGELAPGRLSLAGTAALSQSDPEFAVSDWAAVGGSQDAASYFKAIDDEGPASLKACTEEEQKEYSAMCQKHLGDSITDVLYQQVLEDCVFDLCHGAGETSAELAAEILRAS